MTHIQTEALERQRNHAKLFQCGERQVVAFLFRDDDSDLCVAFQVWIPEVDEQLRVAVTFEDDDEAADFFAMLDAELAGDVIAGMNVSE